MNRYNINSFVINQQINYPVLSQPIFGAVEARCIRIPAYLFGDIHIKPQCSIKPLNLLFGVINGIPGDVIGNVLYIFFCPDCPIDLNHCVISFLRESCDITCPRSDCSMPSSIFCISNILSSRSSILIFSGISSSDLSNFSFDIIKTNCKPKLSHFGKNSK